MARKNRNIASIVQRWQTNGAASATKYKDSIMSLIDNPLDKAADAGDRYIAGIQRAEAEGKRARGLRDYGFDNWKKVTANKGSIRLGQGMAESADRMAKAMSQLLPFIDNLTESLPPRGDLNANLARADKFARGMAAFAARS